MNDKISEFVKEFSGPVFILFSFTLFSQPIEFRFDYLIFVVFVHFVDDKDVLQNNFQFLFLLHCHEEVNQFILNDRDVSLFEKAWRLEHTYLNKLGKDITILKIFVVSD